jgi:hypothetical protein
MRISGWLCLSAVLAACEPTPMTVPLTVPEPQKNAALSGVNFVAFYSVRSGAGDVFLYDASFAALHALADDGV